MSRSTQKPTVPANTQSNSFSEAGLRMNTPLNVNGLRQATAEDVDASRSIHVTANDGRSGEAVGLTYNNCHVIGSGSFGVVYRAKLHPDGEDIAIKRVLQDKRFKNRELQIMRSVSHPNIVRLRAYFYSNGDHKEDVYLNLVLEYVPETMHRVLRQVTRSYETMPILYVKLYTYQLFRSLAYIHSLGICHRDIKPHNLLVDPLTGILKLCDFGSAKVLILGEPNVSYICSRYYRAPELIFGATNYTSSIDIWSTGCVMAELMLGQPLFPGDSSLDQLVEIIKVLGTPSKQQIRTMNPNYVEHNFPQIRPHPFSKVFRSRAPADALDLLAKLLDYTPTNRLTAIEALVHPFFDELRARDARLPDGNQLPPLYDFSVEELSIRADLASRLVPIHAHADLLARGINVLSLASLK